MIEKTCPKCGALHRVANPIKVYCCVCGELVFDRKETQPIRLEQPKTVPGTECLPCKKKKKMLTHCDYLEEDHCTLATMLADKPIPTTPEICAGCQRCQNPMDTNEVTLGLAGIKHSDRGVGTTLANIISWFIAKPEGCACPDREQVMNAWGVEGCEKNLSTILAWLRESAQINGHNYSEFMIKAVVVSIIKGHKVREYIVGKED